MQIVKYPNHILEERIPEFDFLNPSVNPVELEREMLGLMLRNNGIGLAANQVGLKVRMFVMGDVNNPSQAKAFFNPMVVKHIDKTAEVEEGCLSFPGVYVKVKRPTKILAKWQNSKGEWQEGELVDYDCICFLHELDHLEGIVFKDRVSTLRWAMAVKKSKKRK